MNRFFAQVWRGAALSALVLAAPAIVAAGECNLANPPCLPAGCVAGCPTPVAIAHNFTPCAGTGGSFVLTGTEFEGRCSNVFGMCATTAVAPPTRFWQYDAYNKANSGCEDPRLWVGQWAGDLGIPAPPGVWGNIQTSWGANPVVDGCPSAANGPLRTVIEMSFPDGILGPGRGEGTIDHDSWYLIASVPLDVGGTYNFDVISGGGAPGCGQPADIPITSVSNLTITNPSITDCTPTVPIAVPGTPNATAGFFNVTVGGIAAAPPAFNEAASATVLIAGHQVVYATGAQPTTSDYFGGSWQPARDQANPTLAAAVVPVGTTSTTVALPNGAAGTNYWLALRIIYRDATVSPTGTFDPAQAATLGPRLASDIGGHCGPVTAPGGGPIIAVEYGSVTAERTGSSVLVKWTTLSEEDTVGFKVFRSADPAGTESVVEVAPFVEARGAMAPYAVTDTAVDARETYHYYVQELTSQGFGSRSPSVVVEPRGASSGRHSGNGNGRRSR